jgi:TolB protein
MLFIVILALSIASSCTIVAAGGETISITIESKTKKDKAIKQIPFYMGIVDSDFEKLFPLVEMVKKDLEYSGQCTVVVESCALPTSKDDIKAFSKKGYTLACFAGLSPEATALEWRLYDTHEAQMIKGKKTGIKKESHADTAHMVASDLWNELMGNEGPFSTRLCYIKKVAQGRRKSLSQLCIADYDGSNEKIIYSSSRICIAPYWGNDQTFPFIIFSEFTRSNVRLLIHSLAGRHNTALDFEGTLVGVSFATNSSDIIYCRSGEIWQYHYDPEAKRGIHNRVIKEKSPCAGPSLLPDGDIIYCCQGKIKKYDAKEGKSHILIEDGYSVGPSYHAKSNKIVYSRRITGVMQIFIFDCASKKSEQITFDYSDKTDPCWSACGTYVAFCEEKGLKNQIVSLNSKTGKRYALTQIDKNCRYPAWSPHFSVLPDVSLCK